MARKQRHKTSTTISRSDVPLPLHELVQQRRQLAAQLNAVNDQITAIDGLIGRGHLHEANNPKAEPIKPARQRELAGEGSRHARNKQAWDAVEDRLRNWGTPMACADLFKVAKAAGWSTTGSSGEYNNFTAALAGNRKFRRVGKALFDLNEKAPTARTVEALVHQPPNHHKRESA